MSILYLRMRGELIQPLFISFIPYAKFPRECLGQFIRFRSLPKLYYFLLNECFFLLCQCTTNCSPPPFSFLFFFSCYIISEYNTMKWMRHMREKNIYKKSEKIKKFFVLLVSLMMTLFMVIEIVRCLLK
jgi:hypothetical protein